MAILTPAAQNLLARFVQLQNQSEQLLQLAKTQDWPAFIELERHIAQLRDQLPADLPVALAAAGLSAGPQTEQLAQCLQLALNCQQQAEQLAQPQLKLWHDELQQTSGQRRLNQAYGIGES